ncbi:hypothetical protein CEE69_08500 [Rhodopirellula bahusiensis]|uniref:Uncharacterized protein n=1 Tax=Rhodopirellula bahusiensis TaxID=2014065 RepID=A0A2G1W9F3_9BACT|nr:hypothetical protein CEE69_08500 [Rhodopirellula bahusiensis]
MHLPSSSKQFLGGTFGFPLRSNQAKPTFDCCGSWMSYDEFTVISFCCVVTQSPLFPISRCG